MPDGSRYFPTIDDVAPEELWYVEPWDLTGITYPYTWGFEAGPRPFDDFFPAFHLDTITAVKARVGNDVSVHSEIFSPFSQFLELLDYEGALTALLRDPGKVHACLERLTLGAIDLADRQATAGVDAILISSAFAGAGLISRKYYSEFVLPYERAITGTVKSRHAGIKIYTHTCGAIGDRLDLMLETGTDGIDTLDPPPLGTIELEDAVPQLQGKAFIKGNIDAVNTLLFGDEEKVRAAVLRRLDAAKEGGGYILSTACSVSPGTRAELIEYMTQVGIENGAY
jgi:uroporphyrinogen-III decarboxylase